MSDQIESRIQALVAAEVEKQLGRERVILKDAGNLALKIIVGAFGLLFAIFTVFGITTWKDIKTETAALVKTRIEELIQKSDSETGVRQTLNDLVNKAIVSSELIILKGEANKFELPKYEWDCLRS
jgi:hypothetical protein